jgi:hypothetical protein
LLKLGSSNFFEIAMDLDPAWGKGGKAEKGDGWNCFSKVKRVKRQTKKKLKT